MTDVGTDAAGHHETVRREFTKQARHFGEAGLSLSSEDLLQWIVDALTPARGWRALDVATGTGHLARSLAPRVRHVVGIDLTPAMLAEGRRLSREAGLANVAFAEAAAERLPHGDGAFDLVATRLSLHHVTDPRAAVREMARVCRPDGVVAVVDLVAPDDPGVAARYNALERRRDPSHVRALALDELAASVEAAGLTVARTATRDVEMVTERWFATAHTPPDARRLVAAALDAELAGGPPTGMRPFRRDGELGFLHRWAVLLGRR